MQYDMRLTAESIRALGAWVYHGNDAADVELAVDDRMLVAEQGDERMAWDTDGSPASEEYLAVAPLDPTGDERHREVFVTRPHDAMDGVAAFVREEDAEAFAATYDGEVGPVERVTVCGPELAARMIAERTDEEGDAEDRAKDRATCSHCLARTYRGEECVCPVEPGAPEGDAENYEDALDDEHAKDDREARPYVVGEVADPGVIERFATSEEASTYIADTFPASDVESGRYYIDGPEES